MSETGASHLLLMQEMGSLLEVMLTERRSRRAGSSTRALRPGKRAEIVS